MGYVRAGGIRANHAIATYMIPDYTGPRVAAEVEGFLQYTDRDGADMVLIKPRLHKGDPPVLRLQADYILQAKSGCMREPQTVLAGVTIK